MNWGLLNGAPSSVAMANPIITVKGLGEKRQRTGAVQDVARWLGVTGFAPASWSAVALHRFSPTLKKTIGLQRHVVRHDFRRPLRDAWFYWQFPATPWLATFLGSLRDTRHRAIQRFINPQFIEH